MILRDCVTRFPSGLATGDAGWTTAGDLPAQWVIHTVGPNYNTGQRDRSLLESCYRRALEVADELGVRTVAFPLISAGSFGWPRQDAIAAAIESLAAADTRVDEARLVAFDPKAHEEIRSALATWTPIRILQGVQFLHQRGYHRIRTWPGMSPSGVFWRVAINTGDHLMDEAYPEVGNYDTAVLYTTGGLTEFAGSEVTAATRPETVANLILNALPATAPTYDDHAYVSWFAELMRLVEQSKLPPIAYAEYFDASEGWEIGWGSGIRHPRPPKPSTTISRRRSPMSRLPSNSTSSDTGQALCRLEVILQRATGLSPSASAVVGTLIPRGDPQLPGVTIKFAANHVRGADRATLFFDDQHVHLGFWPAELQSQYTYMYSDSKRIDALLDLNAQDGFTVEPNFQLAHRFAQPLQRWFPTRLLSAAEYLHQWMDDLGDGRAGGSTRDEIADPRFFQRLVERRYSCAAEEASLHQWLDSKNPGIQVHVRPGIQILKTWSYAEFFAIDRQDEIVTQVSEAADEILTALGQPNLRSM